MPLTNQQYDSIIRIYEERQNHGRRILEQRRQAVYLSIPEFASLEEQVSSVSVAQGRKLLEGDGNALPDLKKRLAVISSQKRRLLTSHGYPQDYLEPVYVCRDCRDTGYIDGRKCRCFQQMMISLLYEQSNIRELLKTENFDALSYEFYEGEDLARFKNAVITCQNFIKNFNSDYHNLFFYGTVGTGKSFLSSCMAKELIERGHCVIYFSSAGLFDTLSKLAFGAGNKAELSGFYEDIYGCDLVIIDDLGTELTNAFVSSQLFSCLNERHLRKKATLISTNLSLEELRDRYSDRIFSRITSNYEVCKLTGPDIRMHKKRMMNRK